MTTLRKKFLALALLMLCAVSADAQTASAKAAHTPSLDAMAAMTIDSVYRYFRTDDKSLLQEMIPAQPKQNPYSYLWGYSAMFSAVSAMYEATGDKHWLKRVDKQMIRGLDRYYDKKRSPAGYASYVNDAPESDRFYDDNIWLGIDFADLYAATHDKKYLKRAEEIWRFVMSGCDDVMGGGVYWCEQKKTSKNTCSNAPAAVFALKMYNATSGDEYLMRGIQLYKWTRETLMDPADHIYFDNIGLSGKIGKAKFSYNTGQMLQAAAMLYKITADRRYLTDAERMAEASYRRFFEDVGRADGVRLMRGGELWFDAVMARGYLELLGINGDRTYVNAIIATLRMAWDQRYSRNAHGLFGKFYDQRGKDRPHTLLNQAAMIEMMARLSVCDKASHDGDVAE